MFPGRLYDLLEYVESQSLDYIVSWVRNGTAFMVHKPDELLKLLSFFFGQTKYRSFTRQLNMWYFEREEYGPYKGAFSHPYFVKNHKELCAKMSRHEPPKLNSATAPRDQAGDKTRTIIGSSFKTLDDIESRSQATNNVAWSESFFSEEKLGSPNTYTKGITNPGGFGNIEEALLRGFDQTYPRRATFHDDEHFAINPAGQSLSSFMTRENVSAQHHQYIQGTYSSSDNDKDWGNTNDVRATGASDSLGFLNNSLFMLGGAGDALEPNPIAERSVPLVECSPQQETMPDDDFANVLPFMSMMTQPQSADAPASHQRSLQDLETDDDGLYLLRLLQKNS